MMLLPLICLAPPHGSSGQLLVRPRLASAPLLHGDGAAIEDAGEPSGAGKAGAVAGREAAQLPAANEIIHLIVGRSTVLTSPNPLRRIYVGNPAVLQTFTSGQTEIILTSKAVGTSSLILWEVAGGRRLYTVSADIDPASLRSSLRDAFPASEITVETRDGKISLSGTVPSEAISDAALKLALLYDKDIVNSLRVVPARVKQVELKLRIIEVDRTKLSQFGINIFGGGNNAISTSTQQFPSTPTGVGSSAFTAADPLNLLFYNFANAIGASVKDLEQKNVLEVLAEPTLVTISGVPARFLSGGEFPVPVVQGGTGNSTAITIIYRPYGVKVDFTPTVGEEGSIRLKISPEVSTLDYTNAVTISGFTIPALSTRRAETEVVIRDGQSFVISGLLDHRTTDILSRLPGIANVPILGQLFRSKNLNHSVTELALIVTAKIVDPLSSTATPVEPVLAAPVMETKTFDDDAKGLSKTKPALSGQSGPGTDKP